MIESDSDQLLKYKYLFPEKYAAEHIVGVGDELMRRGIDVLAFDDDVYIDCVIGHFPTGWNEEIKEMFSKPKTSG